MEDKIPHRKAIIPLKTTGKITIIFLIIFHNCGILKTKYKGVIRMAGYHTDIEEETKNNNNFRKVLYTGKYQQLVVMSLKPGEDIGEEVHDSVDQFFRIEEGCAKVIIDGIETLLEEDDVVIVPAGSKHNLVNTSNDKTLKLYTIYAPPNHPDKTVHETKEEAEEYEKSQH